MPRVRVATPADAPRILDLHVAAIRELGPAAYDETQVAAWADKDGGPERYPIGDDDHHLVVAETTGGDGTGRVVGYGHLVPGAGEVRAVYVDPDHARAGVGSALLAGLEGYALGSGLDRLGLSASRNAVGFYERHGYRAVDRATIEREHEGRTIPFPVTTMRRDLHPR